MNNQLSNQTLEELQKLQEIIDSAIHLKELELKNLKLAKTKEYETMVLEVVEVLNEQYEKEYQVTDCQIDVYSDCTYICFLLNGERVKIDITNPQSPQEGVRTLIKEVLTGYYTNTYIGTVYYEDWCGGHGADDYMLNNIYMRDIMSRFVGKRVRISVID